MPARRALWAARVSSSMARSSATNPDHIIVQECMLYDRAVDPHHRAISADTKQ